MNRPEHTPARLTARRKESDVILVETAGDWLDRTALPDILAVEKELAGGGVKELEFEALALGRWVSTLLVRVLAGNR